MPRQSKDIDERSVQIEALRGVHDYSDKLLSAVSASGQCLDAHPNLGLQVGAQLVGVAGQYTSGLVSGGLIAGASLINNLVGFFKDQKLNKELKNLDSARKSEAVGCALEAVSRTMCQARDYLALVNAKTEGGTCVVCQSYEEGLQILKNQLQSYSIWVQRVSAGAPALTPGQASDKNQAYQLQQKYDSFLTNVDVAISQGVAELAGATNQGVVLESVLKEIRGQIETAASTSKSCFSSGSCVTERGVLAKTFSKDPTCGPGAYILSSGKEYACPLVPGENCDTCLDRIYPGIKPSIDQLKTSVIGLKLLAQQNLNQEKQKFLETDPLLALAKVDATQTNNFSAREFLINTKAYFEKRLNDPKSVLGKSSILKQAIVDAKTRIEKSIAVIDKQSSFGKDDVISVASELIPSNNIFFISDKLNELVQQEYAQAIKSSKTVSESNAIAEYSVQESVSLLLSQYGNKMAASAQAETAQSQSAQTLKSLENIFSKSILDSVMVNAKNGAGTTLLAVQCFRALMLPSLKDSAVMKVCENTALKTEKKGKTYVLKFKDLVKQNLDKRACGIYDFSRKEQIINRASK